MSSQHHQSASDERLANSSLQLPSLTPANALPASTSGIKPEPTPSVENTKDVELKLKFGEETHQYVRDYIKQADQKATFLFAAIVSTMAYLNSKNMAQIWISNPKAWGIIETLSFASIICLVFSAILCALTITPRLKGSKRGILFFNAICEYESSADYAIDLSSKTILQLCEAKYKHIHEIASVCKSKYQFISLAFKVGMVGILFVVLLLLFK